MNTPQAPRTRAPSAVVLLLASCALVVGCGGGGGGEGSASTTSQSITPSNPATAAAAASALGEAASAPADSASSAQAATPGASAPTSVQAATSSAGAATATAASSMAGAGSNALGTSSATVQGPVVVQPPTNAANASQQATTQTGQVGTGLAAVPAPPPEQAASAPEEPTATAFGTTAGNLDRLKAAIADMTLAHEMPPAGVASTVGWKYKPAVAMGTEPYGSAIGSWWIGQRYPQWRGILTWFVIYPGENGNSATNSAVEINGMELWYLSAKDKVWRRLQAGGLPTWNDAYAQNAITASTS